jgi:hypothetical protein
MRVIDLQTTEVKSRLLILIRFLSSLAEGEGRGGAICNVMEARKIGPTGRSSKGCAAGRYSQFQLQICTVVFVVKKCHHFFKFPMAG